MPIEQINNALRFRVHYTASKVSKTGLTVTVDVFDPAGTQIFAGAAATAVGSGLYEYVLAAGSVTLEGEYTAVFKTADGTVDVRDIPVQWSVQRAGVEALALIGAGGNVTVVQPVSADGTVVTMVRGDDYNSSDARQLDFTDTAGAWPDLTSATIKATFSKAGHVVEVAGTVIVPSGAGKKVRIQPTSTQTRTFQVGVPSYRFDIEATLQSGRIVTLVLGDANVLEDYTRQ